MFLFLGFHYQFPMDKITGTTLEADRYATTTGNPAISNKGVQDGALVLMPNQSVAVNNDRNQCFGSLRLCPNGYSIATWLLISNTDCSRYIFSNGGQSSKSHGISLIYEANKGFSAYARTETDLWIATGNTSPPVKRGVWHYVMLAWSQIDGLYLYVNDSLIARNTTSVPSPLVVSVYNNFNIGQSNGEEAVTGCKTSIQLDQMKVWTSIKHPKEVAPIIPGEY